MKKSTNQVSWEERFYNLMQTYRHMPITMQKETADAYDEVKALTRSLLKEERVKAYKQGFNKATEYAKYAIATNNMFENSVKAVRKQVKFEASRRAKSKLSKGKV